MERTFVVAVQNNMHTGIVQRTYPIEYIYCPAVIGRVRDVETDDMQIAVHRDWNNCSNCSAWCWREKRSLSTTAW